jgi:3-phenylpropionate/cinnamic acid dioxygenase small subunit
VEDNSTLSVENRFEIQDLLFRFMRSFDEKDWFAMRACLGETIYSDYSSFRGVPPTTITRDEYTKLRSDALSLLKTQHNLWNISIMTSESEVRVMCNYTILRFHPDFDGSRDKFLHSYGRYHFLVGRIGENWSISSIKQLLLTSEGNSKLHEAL